MHSTIRYRANLSKAIRVSPSCTRGNACDSPQRPPAPERITNWLSSVSSPRQPTPPPRPSEVTPAKPQSPNCNPEPVPEQYTPPIRLPAQFRKALADKRKPAQALIDLPAKPFKPKRPNFSPYKTLPPAKSPPAPTPVAPPAEEQAKPLPPWLQRRLCMIKPKIRPQERTPEVLEQMRAAGQYRRERDDLKRRQQAENNLAAFHEQPETSEPVKPSPSPEAAPDLEPIQTSEPAKPSPSPEAVPDLALDEVSEELLLRTDSRELFLQPRLVPWHAGQEPDLTTVPEQTEPSRSMVTMSALSPYGGLSAADSASFSQLSADSFTRATFFDQGTLNLDTDDAQSSSGLSPMPSSDFPVDQAAFQPPADPTAAEENGKAMDTHELAMFENIAGQKFDAYCGDAIAGLPVRDELKDETSFITGYSSPQMEPLRPASPEPDVSALLAEILSMDPFAPDFEAKVNLHAELRRKKLGLDALPQPEQTAAIDELSEPSEVFERGSSAPASPSQQASSESAQPDDLSASLDEPPLPKVMLAARPPQADVFADVFDIDAPRVATEPAAVPINRPNLFDDLVLREEFYLPAPLPLQQQQPQSTGVLGKIWTKTIAMAKASWTKVKSLVWR